MKKAIGSAFFVTLLVLVAPALVVAESTEPQTFEGEYVWQRQDKDIKGPLHAEFESTGENTWNVSFRFTFEEEEHVYAGTAEGSLDGEISGKVLSDGDEPRPFEFEGKFVDGKFEGTHWAMQDGEKRDTGILTLGR